MQNIYIHEYVNGFGFIQGLLLSLVIYFYPGGNKRVNIFLALHLFCFTLCLAAPFSLKFFSQISPRADRFVEPFLVLIYPFLFLYICSFTEKITLKTIWIHISPFLVFTLLVVLSLTYQSGLQNWSQDVFGFNLITPAFVTIKVILFSTYLYLCLKKIDSTRDLTKNIFSETSRINLNWVRQLIYAGIVLLLAYIIIMTLIVANPSLGRLNFLLVCLVTVYIYFATFRGLSQPEIFKSLVENNPEKSATGTMPVREIPVLKTDNQAEKAKYERSSLPENRQEELTIRLKDLMLKDRLFLEPELTIQILGEKLNISPYYISQVLNQRLKTNFYDFINYYRVEEAKTLLSNPSKENFTILSIAFDSGFNSKTTFNAVFKKFTTLTPTQFKSKFLQLTDKF